jgi:hypothetical protein
MSWLVRVGLWEAGFMRLASCGWLTRWLFGAALGNVSPAELYITNLIGTSMLGCGAGCRPAVPASAG